MFIWLYMLHGVAMDLYLVSCPLVTIDQGCVELGCCRDCCKTILWIRYNIHILCCVFVVGGEIVIYVSGIWTLEHG